MQNLFGNIQDPGVKINIYLLCHWRFVWYFLHRLRTWRAKVVSIICGHKEPTIVMFSASLQTNFLFPWVDPYLHLDLIVKAIAFAFGLPVCAIAGEMARISPMSLVQSGRTGPVTVGIALATVGNRCLHALVRRWDRWRTELAILFFCLWDWFTSPGRRPLPLNMFSGRERWLHFNLPSVSLLLIALSLCIM